MSAAHHQGSGAYDHDPQPDPDSDLLFFVAPPAASAPPSAPKESAASLPRSKEGEGDPPSFQPSDVLQLRRLSAALQKQYAASLLPPTGRSGTAPAWLPPAPPSPISTLAAALRPPQPRALRLALSVRFEAEAVGAAADEAALDVVARAHTSHLKSVSDALVLSCSTASAVARARLHLAAPLQSLPHRALIQLWDARFGGCGGTDQPPLAPAAHAASDAALCEALAAIIKSLAVGDAVGELLGGNSGSSSGKLKADPIAAAAPRHTGYY